MFRSSWKGIFVAKGKKTQSLVPLLLPLGFDGSLIIIVTDQIVFLSSCFRLEAVASSDTGIAVRVT